MTWHHLLHKTTDQPEGLHISTQAVVHSNSRIYLPQYAYQKASPFLPLPQLLCSPCSIGKIEFWTLENLLKFHHCTTVKENEKSLNFILSGTCKFWHPIPRLNINMGFASLIGIAFKRSINKIKQQCQVHKFIPSKPYIHWNW